MPAGLAIRDYLIYSDGRRRTWKFGKTRDIRSPKSVCAEVNVTPLTWSDNISTQCADYNAAKFLAQGLMKHCPTHGFGQNMAQATARSHLTLPQIVDLWGNEKRYFINGMFPSVSSTGSPAAVSHYTAMIWQNTSEVGCGEASARGNTNLVLTILHKAT